MEKIESIRISLKKGIGYLGYAFGNTNIIRNHIAFFEKLAEKEINKNQNLPDPSFSEYPYFGVWIRLNLEHITNKLFYDYCRVKGDDSSKKINEWGFNKFRDNAYELLKFNKKNDQSQIEKYSAAIDIVIGLSHCIRHGGIPNISKNIKDTTRKDIENILNPQNFAQTKQRFKDAEKFSDLLHKSKLIICANE